MPQSYSSFYDYFKDCPEDLQFLKMAVVSRPIRRKAYEQVWHTPAHTPTRMPARAAHSGVFRVSHRPHG